MSKKVTVKVMKKDLKAPLKTAKQRMNLWLVAGLTIILALAVSVFAVRNVQREKKHMLQNYLEHAESLVWALEAGARIGMGMMHGATGYFQSLVVETAKQKGIAYLAVTDERGRIVAHSDAALIDSLIADPHSLGRLHPTERGQGHFRKFSDGKLVFEVYKNFVPLPGRHHFMGNRSNAGRMGMMHMMDMGQENAPPLLVFVGLSIDSLNEALADESYTSILLAILVVCMGLGGFASLFWAQHYRASRRQLLDSRAFAAEVVTCLPLGLVSTDASGRVRLINAVAAQLFGRPAQSLIGTPLENLTGLKWRALTTELTTLGSVSEKEETFFANSQTAIPVSVGISRIMDSAGQFAGYLFLLRDLQEIRRLQEQVRRNERLSALGDLAAGVAHEIRNPLSSIKGFAAYLSGKVHGADKEAARAMVQEADRLNHVVSKLLEFARPEKMRLQNTDLASVVNRALRLVQSDVAAKKIAVHFTHNDPLPPIPLDAERFTQALLNLFLNAVQAMQSGGELHITATHEPNSASVSLRIADTGHGMATELLSDIFNPYFTTKSSGTGLGLAIVHRIVEAHGAEIKVESSPGQGTVFTLLLSVTRRSA